MRILSVSDCKIREVGFDWQQGNLICLFSITSRPALASMCPLIRRILKDFFSRVKQPGRVGDYSPQCSAKFKIALCNIFLPLYVFMPTCLIIH